MTPSYKRAHKDVPAHLRGNARRMRTGMTTAERTFWYAVRAHRLGGLPFRRQVPIAGYVVDFVCHQRRLVVEIDGATHSTDGERSRDALRTRKLEAEGYRVVRFWNHDVARNLTGVLDRLRLELDEAPSSSMTQPG